MTAKGYQGLAFSIVMAFGITACLETPKPFIDTHAAAMDHDMTGGDGNGNPDTTPAAHDYAMNRWAAATVIATDAISETSNFMLHDMKFVSTTAGNGILLRDIHTQTTNTILSYFNATDATWTDTTPLPADQANAAIDISLTPDPSTNNIVAAWSYQDKVYVNTFIADSAQWMSATELGAGKSAKILIDASGNQNIFTYTTMTNGYAFGMFNRPTGGSWTTTAAESHRMGSDTAIKTLVTSSITLNKDNNPVLAFVEKTGTEYSLNTIRYIGGAWATGVDTVITATDAINLTQINALEIRADNAGNEIIVLSTGANSQKHIYQSVRASGADWQTASRLDIDKANTHIESGPRVTQSHDGKLFVAWTEHDTTPAPVVTDAANDAAADPHAGHKLSSYKLPSYKIAARDGTGGIQKVVARMLNGTSWGSESHLSTAARESVITALSINTGHEGTPMAMWTEKSLTETRIMSSHFMTGASGAAWMQKELVKSIPSATAQINKTYAYISPTGNGITLWSESSPASSGVGTDFKINMALSSSAVSNHTDHTDTTPETTPETTPDPDDTTDTTPPSGLWSEPVAETTFQHPNNASMYFEGPELFIDNNGTRIIYASSETPNNIPALPPTIDNIILRSTDSGQWQDILTGPPALALEDLTPPILFEQLQIARNTNALIGLLKDASNYYVVRYTPTEGWSKRKITEDAIQQEHLLKLHVDNVGNTTVIVQEAPGYAVVAKYYLTQHSLTQVEQPTASTFTTSSMNSLLDTSSTADGTVHIGWIDANRLHTAKYPPGGTWQHDSVILDIGALDPKKTKYSVTYGEQEVIILNHTYTDNNSQKHQLKASVRNANSGTWSTLSNISNISDAQIIEPTVVNNDGHNFMLVWKQQMQMTMNGVTMPVNQFHTAFFDASTATWSAPTMIGNDTHGQQSNISIIMHDDTTATAAWIDRSGQTTSVYSSSFDATNGWGESQMLASYAINTEGTVTRLKTAHNYAGYVAAIWDNILSNTNHVRTIWISKQN